MGIKLAAHLLFLPLYRLRLSVGKFGTPENLGFVSLTAQGHRPKLKPQEQPKFHQPEENVMAFRTEFRREWVA